MVGEDDAARITAKKSARQPGKKKTFEQRKMKPEATGKGRDLK